MSAEHETDPALLGRVHFIGMGGAGMSAVAKLMLARGVPVSGSDTAPDTFDAIVDAPFDILAAFDRTREPR